MKYDGWYYQLVSTKLPMNLQRKIFNVEASDAAKGKIIVIKSSRYNNVFFEWKKLEEFKDKMLFIGLDEEHDAFCKDYFKVDRLPVSDALDAAKAIAGAKMTIGNPSGLFSIAEMMKTPRCLVTPEFLKWQETRIYPGPVNVVPQGGEAFMAATTGKAYATLKEAIG